MNIETRWMYEEVDGWMDGWATQVQDDTNIFLKSANNFGGHLIVHCLSVLCLKETIMPDLSVSIWV